MAHLERVTEDWHRAEILARLKIKGTSLAEVSRNAGLNSRTLSNVFYRHYPKGEKIIADELGLTPKDIWPSRIATRHLKKLVSVTG